MRIDKFLWCVRFYKTRSIASEDIKKNRVSVADQVVKSSREVKEGDLIKIRKNQIDYQLKILQLPKSRLGAKLVPLYIQDKTPPEQYELLRMRRLSQDYFRNKGEGRPTKKDRRSMDDFLENENAGTETESDWDVFFSVGEEDDEHEAE